MNKFEESNFYKALQDFFINNNKDTFLQFLAEFYNRTESIIDKNNIQDDLIKELRELYLEFNEKGIDNNIVREKVNYFLENSLKIKDIISKLTTNTNNIKNISSQLDKKANESDLKTTNNRIDNLIIHSGEGIEKDSELIDTRMDFEGKIHSTTGECVRSQAEKIFDYAKVIGSQISIDIFDGIWKQGYINENNGNVVSAPNNLTTELYVKKPSESFEVSLEEKISWIGVYFYNGGNPIPVSKKEGNNIDYLQFKIPANADRFAIVVGSDTGLTPETMIDFHILDRNNILDLLVEDLNIFDNKFVQGYIYETSGNIKDSSNNLTSSNFIYCKTNEKYEFKSDGIIDWFCVFYYNNTSKAPIGKYEKRNTDSGTFIIPENVTRFRFSFATSYGITPTNHPTININYESNKLTYLDNKKQNNFDFIDKQDLSMPFSIPMHIKTLYDKSTIPDGDWRKGHVGMGYDVVFNEKDNKYYMAYACYSGVETAIGMATSTDMINWTEYSNNPILAPTHNGSDPDKGGLTFPQFLKYDNKWIMYYVGYDEVGFEKGVHTICYAESKDLINWTRKGKVVGLEIFTNNNIPMGVIYRPRVRNYFGRYYMFINAGEDDAAHGGASESIYVLVSDNPLKDWKYMGIAVDAEVIFANEDYKICSDPDVIYNGKEFIMTFWSYKGVHFMKCNNSEFPLNWHEVTSYFCNGLGRPVFVPTEKALYMLCNRAGAGATVSLQKADWS